MRVIAISFLAMAMAVFALPAQAQIKPPMDGYEVSITYSGGLERRMESINNMEQTFEDRFRERRNDSRTFREAGTQRFAKTRTEGTEWAGERLIETVEGFTLDNLIKAMVAYNINRVAPDFRGKVEIGIDRLKISNHNMAFLNSFQSYASGRIKVTDSGGAVLYDDKVTANLVINPTVDRSYDGPDLAFGETEPSNRVGPTLAYFVERALRKVWPDNKDDIRGPIIVRISGPNERVIFN